MKDNFSQQMILYYDERAEEYDEIYRGRGPAIPDFYAYQKDAAEIGKLLSEFGQGDLVDVGCGTGFWLPFYAKNCSHITLLDKSEKMLSECKRRVLELRLVDKCHLVQGDFFGIDFENSFFDSAVVGFFVSHLRFEVEQLFFEKLKKILKPKANLIFLDSAWSEKRKKYRKKQGMQKRILYDGRRFAIYKRYFDKSDIQKMFFRYHLKIESFYAGDVFLGVVGVKKDNKPI